MNGTVKLSLPPQEKAVLFLLFLNPLRQTEFIKQFSSEDEHTYLTNDFEEVNVAFFETVIALMHQLFQLSLSQTKEDEAEGQTVQERFFAQLMKNYNGSKERFEGSLVLTLQLTGSLALQEWIKKRSVRHYLQIKGYYLLEETQITPLVSDYNKWQNVTEKRKCGVSINDP